MSFVLDNAPMGLPNVASVLYAASTRGGDRRPDLQITVDQDRAFLRRTAGAQMVHLTVGAISFAAGAFTGWKMSSRIQTRGIRYAIAAAMALPYSLLSGCATQTYWSQCLHDEVATWKRPVATLLRETAREQVETGAITHSPLPISSCMLLLLLDSESMWPKTRFPDPDEPEEELRQYDLQHADAALRAARQMHAHERVAVLPGLRRILRQRLQLLQTEEACDNVQRKIDMLEQLQEELTDIEDSWIADSLLKGRIPQVLVHGYNVDLVMRQPDEEDDMATDTSYTPPSEDFLARVGIDEDLREVVDTVKATMHKIQVA